jgi:hypothetical protein
MPLFFYIGGGGHNAIGEKIPDIANIYYDMIVSGV